MPAQKFNTKGIVTSNLDNKQRVGLSSLSELTGFPIDLLKKELLLEGVLDANEEISIEELREAMAKFVNKTLLEVEKLKDQLNQ